MPQAVAFGGEISSTAKTVAKRFAPTEAAFDI
jgi:hypothetical protein